MKAVLALALLFVGQPQQFDLICKGGPTTEGALEWSALDIHLRVDLAKKQWCEGECKILNDIVQIQPSQLWLEQQSEFEKARQTVHFRAVNRETGLYTRIQESAFGSIAQRGQCEPAPFSGFPKLNTKF